MERCNCFEDKLEAVKKLIPEQIGDHTDLHVNWKGYLYYLTGGDHCPVLPKLEIEYRRVKVSGKPYQNLTKDSIGMSCKFCPFCGREYAGELKAKEEEAA